MVVGSNGLVIRARPEIPAGPTDDSRSGEALGDAEDPASVHPRLQEILADHVAGPGDRVHVPIPLLEDLGVGELDLVEDPTDPLPNHGHALPGVDDREVEVASALDQDPVVAEVELVQLAVLAVDERVADE